MRTETKGRFLVGLLAVIAVGLLGWQRHTAAGLRAELALRARTAAEASGLARERKRLEAAQVTPEEMARGHAERVALSSLLGELEAVRRRLATNARPERRSSANVTPEAAAEPVSLLGHTLSAAQWRNAGQATPEAAFETALWAAAGGDLGKLAELLALDDATRVRAGELFARLPAPFRQELATPERFVALLTAYNVPLGSAQIVGKAADSPEATQSQLATQLTDAAGAPKEVLFTLQTAADSPRWRLVVPFTALDRYAMLLSGETTHPR